MTRKSTSSAARRRQAQQASGIDRRWLIAGGVGLVLVAAAVIALALANTPQGVSEPADDPVVVTGTPLVEYAAGVDDPAIGELLPTLQGVGLDGAPLTIGPDGRAKAIVILAHWCPHCQTELPRLVEWLASNPIPDGVDVVGLSTYINAARPNYPPSAWFESVGWQQPTLIDDAASTAGQALGSLDTPGWVFVAANGAVQGRTTGEIDPATFGEILDQLAP